MDKYEGRKTTSEKYVEAETVSEDSEVSSLSTCTDTMSEKCLSKISSDEVLIIEPFYGGSHQQLIDILDHHLRSEFLLKTCVFSLPAKKWHWRARTSALYFSKTIPENINYKILFCSSVLNLAELIALRLDLSKLHKIIYFHENQLVYPIQKYKERDFQYGYNQILSALVADDIIFNSYYNMNSFLNNINSFLNIQPDYYVKDLNVDLVSKCSVVYFPIHVPHFESEKINESLHIIWPHRWEHDKNPELFFEILFRLKNNNIDFKVSVLGESYERVPEIFHKAKEVLKNEILQFGRLDSKTDYFKVLRSGHVVVSTALHEFFGVAMVEAVLSGCYPIACNRLVYPEIYPKECLYNTPNQLYKKLKNLCEKPYLAEVYLNRAQLDLNLFKVDVVMNHFKKYFLDSNFI